MHYVLRECVINASMAFGEAGRAGESTWFSVGWVTHNVEMKDMGKTKKLRRFSWTLALGTLVVVGCSSSKGAGPGAMAGSTGGTGVFTPGASAGASGGVAVGGQAGTPARGGTGGSMGMGSGGITGGRGAAGVGTAGAGAAGAGMAGAGMATAGSGGGSAGAAGNSATSGAGCTPAPSGTFQTMAVTATGPGGNYTIYRPTTLGENGFLHPPVAWGNGLSTVPSQYDALLKNVASNGFVVIANPGTGSDPMVVRQGLEWLIAQNASGDYAGKLAMQCAGTIGYSMGGGAAVGSGAHPDVRAVVSVHGLQDASEKVSGPLLLTTSNDDGFVTPSGFVQPCYDRSSVQPTIMATFITTNTPSIAGHLTPLGDGQQDAEPLIAWLRYWLYGDQAQKQWFFGASCKLCVAPWGMIQKKNYTWD